MFSSTVPHAKFHLAMMKRLVSSPLQWPKDSPVPIIVLRRKTRFLHGIHLATHVVYGSGMVANFLLNLERTGVTEKMSALVFLGGYCISFTIRPDFLRKERQLQRLVKAFISFERKNGRGWGHLKRGDLVTEVIQLMGVLVGPVMGVLLFALLSAIPCLPPFLRWILSQGKCDGNGLCSSCIWKLLIKLFDAYMWGTVVLTCSFYILGSCAVGMRCLEHNLKYAKLLLKSGSARQYREGFRVYRQVQLLGCLFNELYQGLLIPGMMMGIWVTFLSGLYGCVKLHGSVPMPGFAFLPFTLLLSGVAEVGVGMGAGVARESERCLDAARNNNLSNGRKSLYKRVARRMTRVKVKFGSTNWIDHLTPFNLVNHALNNCVTAMLLSR